MTPTPAPPRKGEGDLSPRRALFSPATPRGDAHIALTRLLSEAGLASPSLDARLLLCAALGIDHVALVRDPSLPLGGAALALQGFAARRLNHEPVSRITGQKEFWGLPFQVTPAVLDPRPDTEILVETAVSAMTGRRSDPLRVLDLGTGSGAILAALLHEWPASYGIGIDISFAACKVAHANLAALGLGPRSAIVQSSWTTALQGRFDVIVSNPPYIPAADIAALARDVRDYDPRLALEGGVSGLVPYEQVIPALPRLLAPGGVAAFETGSTQAEAVSQLFRAAGFAAPAVKRDLAGHDRVVFGLSGG